MKLRIGGIQYRDSIFIDEFQDKELKNFYLEIDEDDEFEHFGILGATGSGKTVTLKNLMYQVKCRHQKMIIHDFKQDLTKDFYDPFFDEIFNPVCPQISLQWNIFNDIKNKQDIDIVVNSLVPNSNSNDPFWEQAGKNVLKALFRYLFFTNPKPTNKDIWNLICQKDDDIYNKLKKHEETAFYADIFKNMQSKTTQSVMEVLKTHVECFEYLADFDGDFSIRRWVNSGTGAIFVQNNKNVQDTIKPLITLFLDLTSKFALAQADQKENKIWFFLDEIGELQQLDSIISLLTQGRSKAAICVIATQGHSNLELLYGPKKLAVMMNALSNLFVLKMNEDNECKYFANRIGTTRVTKRNVQHNSKGQHVGVNEHEEEKLIVQPYQIKNAEKRLVFCKSASNKHWTFVKVFPKEDYRRGFF